MPGELRSRHPRAPPLIYRGSSLSKKQIQKSAPQYIYYRKSVTTESTFVQWFNVAVQCSGLVNSLFISYRTSLKRALFENVRPFSPAPAPHYSLQCLCYIKGSGFRVYSLHCLYYINTLCSPVQSLYIEGTILRSACKVLSNTPASACKQQMYQGADF